MASRPARRTTGPFADAFMKAHEDAGDDGNNGPEYSCRFPIPERLRSSRRELFVLVTVGAIVTILTIQFWEFTSWITLQQHYHDPSFDELVQTYLDDRRNDPASFIKTALDVELEAKYNESCVTLGSGHMERTLRSPGRCLSREVVRRILVNITLITSAVFTQYNITHFLDSGTLLGAARHKSIIPFDQDVDIGIDADGYDMLKKAPILFPKDYVLHVFKSSVHPRGSRYIELPVRVVHRPSTLYADVFVYMDSRDEAGRKNATGPMGSGAFINCFRCQKLSDPTKKEFKVPYDWIYPLQGCRFAGYELPCPHKPHEYLVHMFGKKHMKPVVFPY